MYVIAVYDVGKRRVGKMLKLCRRYLNWIQNSVFEGEITEAKLLELKLPFISDLTGSPSPANRTILELKRMKTKMLRLVAIILLLSLMGAGCEKEDAHFAKD